LHPPWQEERLNLLEAILLGVLQGLTEFLPVSSTAHLTLAGKLLRLIDAQHPEGWTQFIAVMQLGTIAAVLVYFRRDIITMLVSLVRDVTAKGLGFRTYGPESLLALFIGLGTLPVAVIGFGFRHYIEGAFTKTTIVLSASLVVMAAFLWLAEKLSRRTKSIEQVTWLDSLLIGCAQALALIPGASRSGTTLTAALLLGLTRESAARFSFLLSIPAVLASGFFEMIRIDKSVFELGLGNLVVATVVSGIAGYAAIDWLLRYLRTNSTLVFVWYRFALGLALILMLLWNVIDA
jgi:undecaprenyl-diphosphatase